MIEIERTRNKNGVEYVFEVEDKDTAQALAFLVESELQWGGRVVEVTPEKLVVETYLANSLDRVTFIGTKEEMKPLLMMVYVLKESEPLAEKEIEEVMVCDCSTATKMLDSLLIASLRINTALTRLLGVKAQKEIGPDVELAA